MNLGQYKMQIRFWRIVFFLFALSYSNADENRQIIYFHTLCLKCLEVEKHVQKEIKIEKERDLQDGDFRKGTVKWEFGFS